jgi:MSHA biogenesis protein MshK
MPRRLPIAACLLLASLSSRAVQDPTRPTDPALYFGSERTPAAAPWSLQSILSSSTRRIAVINGTRVKEGDRVGTARVVRIGATRVVLNNGGRTLTLRLWPEAVEKVRP